MIKPSPKPRQPATAIQSLLYATSIVLSLCPMVALAGSPAADPAAVPFVPTPQWRGEQEKVIDRLLKAMNSDNYQTREEATRECYRVIENQNIEQVLAWWDLLGERLDQNEPLRTFEVRARLEKGVTLLERRSRQSCFEQVTHCDRDGGNLQALDPEVLSDGRIVFYMTGGDATALWILDPTTGRRRQLTRSDETHDNVEAYDPDLLPDGRIVYSTDRTSDGVRELWTLDLKSDERTRLTRHDESHGSVNARDPVVLPDGRILYSTDHTMQGKFELWVLDPATGNKERLPHQDENDNPLNPTVLPDGKIVYESHTVLWKFDPKTGERQQLTSLGGDSEQAFSPTALPGGSAAYYSNRAQSGGNDLWIVDPKTGDRHQLTHSNDTHDSVDAGAPAAMPDGRILFRTDRAKAGVYDLWIVDAEKLREYQSSIGELRSRLRRETND